MARRPLARRALAPWQAATFAVAVVSTAPDAAEAQRRRPHRTSPSRPSRPHRSRPARTQQPATTEPAPETTAPPPPVAATTQPETTSASASATTSAPPPPPPAPEPGGPRPAAIDVSAGFRVFGRQFAYNQDLFHELRSYALDLGPSVAATLEWYPGAHFSRGPASWFGIVGSFDYAFGLSSQDSANHAYATTAWGFTAGLRARVPIGLHDFGLIVAYGQQVFTVAAPVDPTDIGIPGVAYQFIRVGPSVRVGLHERVGLLLGASYLGVITPGPIASSQYFPHATAGGVDATLGLAIRVVLGLEFRLLFEGRRYFYGMHPVPMDRWVAGGALDQYYSGTIALAFRR